MSQTNGSLLQSKKQILQKDLSFSNQIFKKSFNYQNIHSSKSSHQNLTKNNHNNNIPPLIKYTQQTPLIKKSQQIPPKLVQHQKQTNDLVQRKHQLIEQNKRIQQNEQHIQQQLNIFQRKLKPFVNKFNQAVNNREKYSSIPSLSKLQQKIARKYQKQQNSNSQQNEIKPTFVHFDNTQNYQQSPLNSSRNKILNIESLQQSRIANHSIERHNNWIVNNIGDNSGFFQDNNTILTNLSKKSLNKRNVNRSLMNNSFKNINPLQMVNNSLHLSHLPQFVEDDQSSQQNVQQKQKQNNETNLKTIQQKLRVFNNLNNNQLNNNKNIQNQQKKQVNFKKMTIDMYQHYLLPYLTDQSHSNQLINQFETSSIPDSILINDFQPQNKGFDLLTTKSTPIHNQSKNLPFYQNQKTVSEINKNLYIEQNSFEDNYSNLTNTKRQQHFIHDKTPQQIISAVLSDPNKLKLYIKYLQLQIALNNKENQNISQNFQLLTCILIKINQITDKNQTNSSTSKTLAQSILDLSRLKLKKQKNVPQLLTIKPQIIRSSNGIKINFDPYLTSQTNNINSKISYLKKCLQQKNKQSQLIKLNYDAIIHNYATTLENLAKKNQNKQFQNDQNCQQSNQNQKNSTYTKSQYHSQTIQQKNYLDVNDTKNRSSFQQNKIHRKATFGKVPSSFKGSDFADY